MPHVDCRGVFVLQNRVFLLQRCSCTLWRIVRGVTDRNQSDRAFVRRDRLYLAHTVLVERSDEAAAKTEIRRLEHDVFTGKRGIL